MLGFLAVNALRFVVKADVLKEQNNDWLRRGARIMVFFPSDYSFTHLEDLIRDYSFSPAAFPN